MTPNTIVYAVLHGRIIKAILVAINESIETAYIRHENHTVRVTTDSVFETYDAAVTGLAAA